MEEENLIILRITVGVNDLYTDPQIHSSDGTQFGTGNLGLRGMALFLFTHHCNFLCKKLTLPEFDNYPLPCEATQPVEAAGGVTDIFFAFVICSNTTMTNNSSSAKTTIA